MKYYIATSLLRMKEHNIVRDSLKNFGHQISYDWTLHGSVKSISKERLKEVSIHQCEAIKEADCVIVLLPGRKGTHTELGLAIVGGKKIFIHSEDSSLFELGSQTVAFYHHPGITHLTCPLSEVAMKVCTAFPDPVVG